MASRVRIFPWSCTALLRPRLRLRARPPRSSRAWLTPCRKNPAAHPGGGRRRGAAGDRVRGSSPAPHRRHERLPSATGYRIPPVPHRLEPCPASPTRVPPPRHRLSNTSGTPPARALPRIADTVCGGAPGKTRPVLIPAGARPPQPRRVPASRPTPPCSRPLLPVSTELKALRCIDAAPHRAPAPRRRSRRLPSAGTPWHGQTMPWCVCVCVCVCGRVFACVFAGLPRPAPPLRTSEPGCFKGAGPVRPCGAAGARGRVRFRGV